MTPLITMLEQADCGSRELDARIEDMRNPLTIGSSYWPFNAGSTWDKTVPHYTTSIDAALSALPEGWEYSITTVYGFATVELPLNCGDHVPSVRVIRGDCNTALALITAILKATREAGE